MNIHQLSELVLKMAAILCFTYALSHLGYYFSFFFIEEIPPAQMIITNAIGPILGPVIVGGVLIFNAKNWGKRLVESEPSKDQVSINEWHTVFISLMGLFIVVKTIIPLVNHIFALLQYQSDHLNGNMPIGLISWFVGYLVTIAIGLWLFLGARGVTGILKKLRYAGT